MIRPSPNEVVEIKGNLVLSNELTYSDEGLTLAMSAF